MRSPNSWRTIGLENRLLKPFGAAGKTHAPVKLRERLGGILSYYYCEAV
jgi:hypothetical protein